MAEFADGIRDEIRSRLAVLNEESSRLSAALSALGEAEAPAPAHVSTPSTKTTPRRVGRPRGRRNGSRSDQALNVVKSQPGITIPQIAEAIKIEPNYLYRVMPKLVQDGQVKRDGSGWYPVENTAENTAA